MRIIDFDPLQARRECRAIGPSIKARAEIEHRIDAALQSRTYEVVDDDGAQGDGPGAEEPSWQFGDDLLPPLAGETACQRITKQRIRPLALSRAEGRNHESGI